MIHDLVAADVLLGAVERDVQLRVRRWQLETSPLLCQRQHVTWRRPDSAVIAPRGETGGTSHQSNSWIT
jgi:hypothetical protein